MGRALFRRFGVISALALLLIACDPTDDDPAREPDVSLEPMLQGTPHETPLHRLDSRRPGPVVLIIGGAHGNEPGGWLAAERLVERGPPDNGVLLIIPRADRRAVEARQRSLTESGDLNRMFPGDPDGMPMQRMAYEIVRLVEDEDVEVVIDLHESWEFYTSLPEEPTDRQRLSFLGQTITPHDSQPSRRIAEGIVKRVNQQLPEPVRFYFHQFPEEYETELIVPLPQGVEEEDIPGNSGLHIAEVHPDTASILVEVAQGQALEERIKQQILVVDALLELLGSQVTGAAVAAPR